MFPQGGGNGQPGGVKHLFHAPDGIEDLLHNLWMQDFACVDWNDAAHSIAKVDVVTAAYPQ